MKYTVLGGGNGAFATAGHLALRGFDVSLFELPTLNENIKAINSQGGINVTVKSGVDFPSGFAKVGTITSEASDAVKSADVLCLTVPSFAHEAFAEAIGPHLRDGQIVFLHPANPGGAFIFLRRLKKMKIAAKIILAEAPTLFYACRKTSPTTVHIFGYKKNFGIAAFPSKNNATVMRALKDPFPDFHEEENAFKVEMSNPNTTDHPAPTLLNAGWVQYTKGGFYFYEQGVTEATARAIDAIDSERLAIGKAMGVPLTPMKDLLLQWYSHLGAKGKTTLEVLNTNPAYKGSEGPKSLMDRYVAEDVPYGLVPLSEFGKLVKVRTPTTDLMIDLAELLTSKDFRRTGRTLHAMGLVGKTQKEVRKIYESGLP